jgi:quinol-cytochrome oxidoreductase complex cytochrome b subunit
VRLELASSSREVAPKPSFLVHLHPSLVTARALLPGTTLAAGIAALTLFGALLGSGVLLALHYAPSPAEAYGSVLELDWAVPFGRSVRAIHRWAADALLVVTLLHLVRVVAMAAYRARGFNWLVGLGLLALVLLSSFTGYVLPWDQRAYWGARVVAGLLDYVPALGPVVARLLFGARELAAPALPRLHGLHVTLLPALFLGLGVVHLWRVRRDGGLARPSGSPVLVPARPHLLGREVAVALVVLAVLVAFASLVPAPLGAPADVIRPANPEKAPWYFLGLQELASRSAVVGALALPLVATVLLGLLPFVDGGEDEVGLWVPSRRERLLWAAAAVLTATAVGLGYGLAPAGAGAAAGTWASIAPLVSASLVLGFAIPSFGRRASLRAALVALGLALVVFTIIGACRGPDWVLRSPWEALRGP